MPWHKKAMKDVASCDKPRGGVSNLRSEDLRMGQPDPGNAGSLLAESIGESERTRRTEPS